MIARIEISGNAPAEVIRLLRLLELYPLLEPASEVPQAAHFTEGPPSAPVAALRVRFDSSRESSADTSDIFTLAIIADRNGDHAPPVFVTANATAAVCFILGRALALEAPVLTTDDRMFDVIRAAIALARGQARLLVEGEIGVGKESLIKLIHAASGDPMTLIHAECAGLEAARANADLVPLLAQAIGGVAPGARSGGTIFFNRIEELSLAVQARLLELIHPASESPAARREEFARVRYLAASTRPLAAMVARGEFLAELHRLFDATLVIPPLRARPDDAPMLVRHRLRLLNPALSLNAAAMRTLTRYPFPGNLRELNNFVTRVAIVPPGSATICAAASSARGTIGRAEVIRQLDHLGLDSRWRSHQQSAAAFRATRSGRKQPLPDSTASEPLPGISIPLKSR